MIEGKLGTELWTHQDRIGSKENLSNFPSTNGLNIVNVILTSQLLKGFFIYKKEEML